MSEGARLPRSLPAELTGELPTFVRDLVGRHGDAEVADGDDAGDGELDLDTVEALVDLGVPRAAAVDAVRRDRVPLALTQHEHAEKERHGLDDVVRKSGLTPEVVRDLYVAMGLPVPDRFTRDDVAWARQVARMLEVLPVEAVLRSARARGNAMAAIARSDMAIVRDEIILPLRQAGADDLTIAVAIAEGTKSLEEIGKASLIWLYEVQIRAMLASEIAAQVARSDVDEVELAVGFVDVVGYTALSARVDSLGLDQLLASFESHVLETVARFDEVSVVKYLGDAAMLVASDPLLLAESMLELTTATESLQDTPLSAGMAFGPTIVRDGDYFGATVNLAARLTDLARPWSLLADEDLEDVLEGHFELARTRVMRIRGLGPRRPLAVRWAAEATVA